MIKIEYESHINFTSSGKYVAFDRATISTYLEQIIDIPALTSSLINQVRLTTIPEYLTISITSSLENDKYKLFISSLCNRVLETKMTSLIMMPKNFEEYNFEDYTSHEVLDVNKKIFEYISKNRETKKENTSYTNELENEFIGDSLMYSIINERNSKKNGAKFQTDGLLESESYESKRGYRFIGSEKIGFIPALDQEVLYITRRNKKIREYLPAFGRAIGIIGDIIEGLYQICNVTSLGHMNYSFGALEVVDKRFTISPMPKEELTPDDFRKGSQFTSLLHTNIIDGRCNPNRDKIIQETGGAALVIPSGRDVKL